MLLVPHQPATVILSRLDLQLKSQGFGGDGLRVLWVGFFFSCFFFCFKPFVYVVSPAEIGKVWLEKPGTMAQELRVGPKMQKQRALS